MYYSYCKLVNNLQIMEGDSIRYLKLLLSIFKSLVIKLNLKNVLKTVDKINTIQYNVYVR